MKNLILPLLILLNINLLAQTGFIDDPYQKGEAEDGYRIGEWKYYNTEQELDLIFDYDSNKLVFLKPDSSSYFVYDSTWQSLRLDRQVRYLGSYSNLYDYFARELSSTYVSEAGKKSINTIILLELQFDEKGVLTNKTLIGDNLNYFEEAILEIAKEIPKNWIPAVYEGETVKAKIAFPIIYTSETKEQNQPKIEELDYKGKLMEPIKIVRHGYSK